MTAERIKKWLETKANVAAISPANLAKQQVQDRIIISIITDALKGDVIAAKFLRDTVYGVLKPGEGGVTGDSDMEDTWEADYNLPELPADDDSSSSREEVESSEKDN